MAKEGSQLDRFKEAAREIGTDNDERRFNEKLRNLAKTTPPKSKDSEDE